LIEDATVTSTSTTVWNGEAGYRLSANARLVIEAFNLFDAKVSDIDYFYASRLPGEPGDGVEDIHLHPALPRSARVGVQFSF
jgi:outer membrane receptor protein involved in Fe transport